MDKKPSNTQVKLREGLSIERLLISLNENIDETFIREEIIGLLFNSLIFPEEIADEDALFLLRTTIKRYEKIEIIDQPLLMRELNKEIRHFLNELETKYVLMTSITMHWSFEIGNVKIKDAYIDLSSRRINRFRTKDWGKATDFAELERHRDYFMDLKPVLVHVKARTKYHALQKAFYSLELIRAIWNFCDNERRPYGFLLPGKVHPINEILIGPLHTLHDSSGKLIDDSSVFFNPYFSYKKPERFLLSGRAKELFFKNVHTVRTALRKSHNRSLLEKSLMRYSSALDIELPHPAFLELWSTLEMLLLKDEDKNTNDLLKRAAFIHDDYARVYEDLKILRAFRNDYVHRQNESEVIGVFLYRLKRITENCIWFFLLNTYGNKPHKELLDFMSLSHEPAILKEKISLLKEAYKFRSQ